MNRTRSPEEQILGVLKEAEGARRPPTRRAGKVCQKRRLPLEVEVWRAGGGRGSPAEGAG